VAKGYNRHVCRIGLNHLQVTGQYLKGLFGRTMTEIADVIFAEIEVPRRYEIMQACMDEEHVVLEEDPCAIAYPGVVETMERLAKNHRLFIVSNSQSGYPQLCIEKMGLQGLITDHLCFGDTGTPKGETIRRLMEKNGITNAAYVGDTQGDLDASEAAGIPFIFCAFGFGEPDHWYAKVDAFQDLLKL
jgi:phosphoglycolate phosphatase